MPEGNKLELKKFSDEKKIAYGLVYEPNVIDAHGDMMTSIEIEKLAYKFLKLPDLSKVIDIQHDGKAIEAYPVESFIARKGDSDFKEGSWIVAIKVEDSAVWDLAKRGILNGFSYEVKAYTTPTVVPFESVAYSTGVTEETEGHSHVFYAEYDGTGLITKGYTSEDAGHSHTMSGTSATDITDGHGHRFEVGIIPSKTLLNLK
jgi:hypothetical protein